MCVHTNAHTYEICICAYELVSMWVSRHVLVYLRVCARICKGQLSLAYYRSFLLHVCFTLAHFGIIPIAVSKKKKPLFRFGVAKPLKMPHQGVFFCKRNIGLFCEKRPAKIIHSMSLGCLVEFYTHKLSASHTHPFHMLLACLFACHGCSSLQLQLLNLELQ